MKKKSYYDNLREQQQNSTHSRLPTIEGDYQPEVYQAATELSEINSKVASNTPVGKMIDKTHSLAEAMAQLSSFAAKGNKTGILSSSKDIVSLVAKIKEDAKEAMANCVDPKMRAEILNYSIAIENYAVQLKILCAVKASSPDEKDPEAEEQLSLCAKNLANALQNCIKYSEISQLKR